METWRLISDGPAAGAINMAVDEALLTSMAGSLSAAPTLRLYGWSEPTLSVGRMQKAGPFNGFGVPLVRRISGGRAVLHHMELTYSVVCGGSHPLFGAGIQGSYRVISACILRALLDVGVVADMAPNSPGRRGAGDRQSCFEAAARHEIRSGGGKLVGSSQRRLKTAFLQHGSILLDVDPELTGRVFGNGAHGVMSTALRQAGVSRGELEKALVRRMREGLGADFREGALSDAERRLEDDIFRRRYSSPAWNQAGEDGAAAGAALRFAV